MADTALTFAILGKDAGGSRTLRNVGREADRTKNRIDRLNDSYVLGRAGLSGMATAALALGPALLPVLAGATVAAGGLSTALVAGGAALGVFGAVAAASFTKMKEGVETLRKAEEKLAKASTVKARATATKELAAAQKSLVGPVGDGAKAYVRLGNAWQAFQKANEKPVSAILARGMNVLTAALPKLQPLFVAGANAASKFVAVMERAVKSGGFSNFVRFLASQAAPALDSFGRIMGNLGRLSGNLLTAFAPVAQGVLKGLTGMTAAMARWAAGPGMDRFILTVTQNGPAVAKALTSIAAAAVAIAAALGPVGVVALQVAGSLAAIIASAPPGVITGIAVALISVAAAMKAVALAGSAVALAKAAWSPWGVAIAVAAVALGTIAGRSAAAKARITDLTAAILADNGALAENSRLSVVNALTKDGTLEAARKLGIGLKLVTDAAMGDANAQRQVTAAMEARQVASDKLLAEQTKGRAIRTEAWEQQQRDFESMKKVTGAISSQSQEVRKASQAAADQAEALGRASLAQRQAGAAAKAHAVQVGGLNAQIAAAKSKIVQIRAAGAANAAAEVARLNAEIAAARSKVITIRTNRIDTIIEDRRLARPSAYPRAAGGPVSAGTPYIVGEKRPELFVPDRDGTILPRVPALSGASGRSSRPMVVQLVVGGKVLQQVLLQLKRDNGGVELGLA